MMQHLGKGNLSFCCTSSQEKYFGLIGEQIIIIIIIIMIIIIIIIILSFSVCKFKTVLITEAIKPKPTLLVTLEIYLY